MSAHDGRPGGPGRRRRALAGAAAVAAVAVGALVVRSARGQEPPPIDVAQPASLVLSGPDAIDVGDEWTISVDGLPAGATEVEAFVISPWGVVELSPVGAVDGRASVTVPADATTRSGRLVAAIRAGGALGRIGVDVEPGAPVDGVTPLAGPRSVIADLEHWTMVTALPRDRFGNVIADGSPVTVHVQRPDGSVGQVTTEVEGLLAHVRVFSQTRAGRITLRIGARDATGPEVEVLEVPGPPVAVELVDPDRPLRADGRMLVTLTTDVLADQYGNVLLDGTEATVRIDGPSGSSALRAVTIDGRAEFVIEAPPRPGPSTVRVTVDGVASSPLVLDFAGAVSALPIAVARAAASDPEVAVTIGPVRTMHGGFVPDGTTAVVTVDGRHVAEVDLRDGVAEVVVEAARGAVVGVDVLGRSAEERSP